MAKETKERQAVSLADSNAYIIPWEEVVSTQKFSRLFRERFAGYSLDQLHLIAHWIDSHKRYRNHSVPIPYNAFVASGLRSLDRDGGLQQLLDDGILERTDYSKERHECREYTAGPVLRTLLTQEAFWLSIQRFLVSEDEKIVRFADGRLAGHRTHQRQTMTPLNKKVLSALSPNLINHTALAAEYEALKARMAGTEDRRHKKRPLAVRRCTQRLVRRWKGYMPRGSRNALRNWRITSHGVQCGRKPLTT